MHQRTRRPADEAKLMILQAAEKRLKAGGPNAVRVQLVARDLGLTDAAVHHHFGNRKGLQAALLRHAGRGLRERIEASVRNWSSGARDLGSLSELIADCYERDGYARLAMWLSLSGWSSRGSGMLAGLVEAMQRARASEARAAGLAPPSVDETRCLVALFHMVQVAEPLFGDAMRRSAGLAGDAAARDQFRGWTLATFEHLLQTRGARPPPS